MVFGSQSLTLAADSIGASADEVYIMWTYAWNLGIDVSDQD